MATLPFARFASAFLGLEHKDPVVGDGRPRRRVYLDTTATALMSEPVWRGMEDYLEIACANSHTDAHRAGRETTEAIEQSRAAIGRLVGYQADRDIVLFTANGATGATNFLARALFPPELRPTLKRFGSNETELLSRYRDAVGASRGRRIDEMRARPLIVTSLMEHHSNLLPWMEAVGHENVRAVGIENDGTLNVTELEQLLEREGERVRLVAITGLSNVTGISTPVHEIARLTHRVGAELLVDAAQWVPHAPVRMHTGVSEESIDYLVLSGHKMYAPGSRGALIGKLETLESCRCVTDVGGGMVDYVSMEEFDIKAQVTAREEAGTPNIPGSIAMGLIAELLLRVDMSVVMEHEEVLARGLMERLKRVPEIRIYGSTDLDRVPRAGVISFNLPGLPHGLVAAYLNDYHNIAVRNGCFCAQPYVKALLKCDAATEARVRKDMVLGDHSNIPGAVRASLGVYSNAADIDALGDALESLQRNRDTIRPNYEVGRDGTYRLRDRSHEAHGFAVERFIDGWCAVKE